MDRPTDRQISEAASPYPSFCCPNVLNQAWARILETKDAGFAATVWSIGWLPYRKTRVINPGRLGVIAVVSGQIQRGRKH